MSVIWHRRVVPAIERRIPAADQRARRLITELGRELRSARTTHSLSQRAVGRATGVDQAEISRIERGIRAGVTIRALSRLATTVGMDLSIRLFPGGQPLRDQAHQLLLARFRRAAGERWQWATEVPLPIAGDRRAWDRLVRGGGIAIGIEGETKPRDAQELFRRIALKKRDGGVDRVVLVLGDTAWNRRFMRENAPEIEAAFPVPGRVALRAIADGRDPGGDAVIVA